MLKVFILKSYIKSQKKTGKVHFIIGVVNKLKKILGCIPMLLELFLCFKSVVNFNLTPASMMSFTIFKCQSSRMAA